MNGTTLTAFKVGKVVNRFTYHVEQASFHLLTGGNRNGLTQILDLCAALKTVSTVHGNAAHGVFANVLFHLKHQLCAIVTCHR